MTEWLASGIPAAVEAAGPRFLPALIQLLLFGGGAFAAGLFFGRFWLSRKIEIKDAELDAEKRRYEYQGERITLFNEVIAKMKDEIGNAKDLAEAKSVAEIIEPLPSTPTQHEVGRMVISQPRFEALERRRKANGITLVQLADRLNMDKSYLKNYSRNILMPSESFLDRYEAAIDGSYRKGALEYDDENRLRWEGPIR